MSGNFEESTDVALLDPVAIIQRFSRLDSRICSKASPIPIRSHGN